METFSRWKVRIKRKLRVSRTARILAPRTRNWRNRKLRTRDDFAQPCWGRGDRTGSDIKNNGKEERCLRKVSRGAVKHKGNREGREEGKKARNRLTMKLQCNDLTAVFHLARLYVAFCPSNHGWILLPFPCKFISSRDSVREYSYVPYTNFYPEITSWKDWKDFYTIR